MTGGKWIGFGGAGGRRAIFCRGETGARRGGGGYERHLFNFNNERLLSSSAAAWDETKDTSYGYETHEGKWYESFQ